MFECFWIERQGKPDGVAHIINSFVTVETPQGTEGEIYTAICGEEQQSWFSPSWGLEHGFGDLQKVRNKGIPICGVCQGGEAK